MRQANGGMTPRRWRRRGGIAAVVLAGVVGMLMVASGGSARVLVTGSAQTATVTAPQHVDQTVQGCRNDGTITFPSGGPFICPDDAYTGGNLGKGWNELDLVPFRLTTHATNAAPATQTFDTGVAFDAEDGGHPGYDVISPLVLNTSLSAASCVLVSQSAQTNIIPGFGGIDRSIGRTVQITQLKNTTCVFDYYGRLALGSHLFPGSSLHGNLSDGTLSSTNQDVPIPVKEIAPQSISKTMTAQRDTDHTWDVTKAPSPASLNFGNVCDSSFSNTAGVDITVTWTKGAATPSGQTSITTHVYATNPASRTITVSVSDSIYAGTDQSTLIDTATLGPTDIAPNTTAEVGTGHTVLTSDTSTHFNDVATATYTDKDTGITVPGNTTATAGADVAVANELNQSATITDSESITGSGLYFKVASPSVGSFTNGYTAGTYIPDGTLSEVDWSSGSQSSSGSVTFNKTVKLDPAQATSGTLSDTASLLGSDGATASSGELDVNISSSKLVTLTITKDIPNVLQGSETASFTFDVYDSSDTLVDTETLSFAAGDTSKSVDIPNLAPDTYTVKEEPATGWQAQSDQDVDLTNSCSDGATFTNAINPANAAAVKVTDPSGYESGWVMTLNGPGTPSGGENATTDSSGNATFLTDLQEGSYTITETSQTGWTQTGTSGDCSFSVDYPADAGKTFTCTITNKSRGHVDVHKTVNGAAPSGSQSFTFTLRQGATPIIGHPGTILETEVANAANGGDISFTYDLLPDTTYQLCEDVLAGWQTNLGPNPFVPEQFLLDGTTLNPAVDNSPVCVNFTLTPADTATTKTFSVDNTPPPGGRALTIGYWKNHGSCSSSSGKNTRGQLDVVLASFPIASGQTTHGVFIGDLYVDTCAEAVAILNKSDVLTGKKMASDPAYNLAAQLLAYRLNVQAGAGTCAAAISAASAAQSLLDAINFTGTGSYTKKMTAAQQAQANSLANTLDLYNNDLLC